MNAGAHFKEDGDMYYAFDIVLPWIQELKVKIEYHYYHYYY